MRSTSSLMKRCVVARRLRNGERERPISGSVCVSAVNGDGGLLRTVRERGVRKLR